MKINYRPEIDGLRAIAVVAVIFYHAQLSIFDQKFFKGGFIGVDIFFVISGYLITSIILKELFKTGHFSFKKFYERRIRRILPVLLFVMMVSIPFAWVYLLPDSFIDYSNSILSSLGFISNIYFWFSSQAYGAESNILNPFLHTWSLSVEEQYYILFPIILLISFRYLQKYLLTILILGVLISLVMADWGSRNHPVFNFYVLPTRMWELLAGSLLSYFEIYRGGVRSTNKAFNLVLPSVGIFLIGHYIFFYNSKILHPSLYTLSPIIGVCLIIWFSNSKELITKILSSKFFVGVGLISYSLYLWHYPIFALDSIIEFTNGDIIKKLMIVFLIIFLSLLTYFFIEQPARNKKIKFRLVANLLLITISIIVFFNFTVIYQNGFEKRVPEIIQKSIKVKVLRSPKNYKTCSINELSCAFNTLSNKKVYIIGDSHMASLAFDLKNKLVKKNYQFITSYFGACLYFPGFNRVDKTTKKIDPQCNDNYFSQLEKKLNKSHNSIFIFGGRFPSHQSGDYMYEKDTKKKYIQNNQLKDIQSSFEISLNKISENNHIILIYPIPEVDVNVPRKLFNLLPKKVKDTKNYLENHLVLKNYITTSYQSYKNRSKTSFELFDLIKGKNIYRVYPHLLYCDTSIKEKCIAHDAKNIFYSDDNHPSVRGSELINNLIMDKIKKIEQYK